MKKYEEPKMKLHELMTKTAMLAGSLKDGQATAGAKTGLTPEESQGIGDYEYVSSDKVW